jgi:hypothetical protein
VDFCATSGCADVGTEVHIESPNSILNQLVVFRLDLISTGDWEAHGGSFGEVPQRDNL